MAKGETMELRQSQSFVRLRRVMNVCTLALVMLLTPIVIKAEGDQFKVQRLDFFSLAVGR